MRSGPRGSRRSVDRGAHRPAIEPRRVLSWVPTPCIWWKATHPSASSRAPDDPAWSKTLACADALCAGTGRSRDRPLGNRRRSASGRRGAVAGDARSREVRLCHSSWEADEQSGPDRSGAGGAKGRGQGEREPAKHAPESEPGKCVTGAGAPTANRNDKMLCRHTPKVGAVCPNWARTVLCGGRSVMSVPTAISEMSSQIIPLKGRADFRESGRILATETLRV